MTPVTSGIKGSYFLPTIVQISASNSCSRNLHSEKAMATRNIRSRSFLGNDGAERPPNQFKSAEQVLKGPWSIEGRVSQPLQGPKLVKDMNEEGGKQT